MVGIDKDQSIIRLCGNSSDRQGQDIGDNRGRSSRGVDAMPGDLSHVPLQLPRQDLDSCVRRAALPLFDTAPQYVGSDVQPNAEKRPFSNRRRLLDARTILLSLEYRIRHNRAALR